MSRSGQAYEPIPRLADAIARDVVDAALRVHVALGPGLLESAYEVCLAHELTKRGRSVQFQLALPVVYEGIKLDAGYRIDLLVDGAVIVEVKSVEALAPIHEAQVLTYLRLSGKRLGLLINFNVVRLKDGIRRLVLYPFLVSFVLLVVKNCSTKLSQDMFVTAIRRLP